uniref:Uncharacterized protein n=1 Tax=Octopus bimaculoides TaxID=37653 RepID=A0A0L8FV27_OCTBM
MRENRKWGKILIKLEKFKQLFPKVCGAQQYYGRTFGFRNFPYLMLSDTDNVFSSRNIIRRMFCSLNGRIA